MGINKIRVAASTIKSKVILKGHIWHKGHVHYKKLGVKIYTTGVHIVQLARYEHHGRIKLTPLGVILTPQFLQCSLPKVPTKNHQPTKGHVIVIPAGLSTIIYVTLK